MQHTKPRALANCDTYKIRPNEMKFSRALQHFYALWMVKLFPKGLKY
jgi:hypothetical protein